MCDIDAFEWTSAEGVASAPCSIVNGCLSLLTPLGLAALTPVKDPLVDLGSIVYQLDQRTCHEGAVPAKFEPPNSVVEYIFGNPDLSM